MYKKICIVGVLCCASVVIAENVVHMRTFRQDKLIRDKMPEIMAELGSVVHTVVLDDLQFDEQLRIKLIEEAHEVQAAQTRKELVAELADLYEVMDALLQLHVIDREEVLAEQNIKRDKRGGFAQRTYSTIAQHPEGSAQVSYCLSDPEKYPEVVDIQVVVDAWKEFILSHVHDWPTLIAGVEPISSGCGFVYELPNYLNRPNEDFAIVDMSHISCSEPHYHPKGCYEMYFVLQGTGCIVVGETKYTVVPGDAVVIEPEQVHYAISDGTLVVGVVNTPPFAVENYLVSKL